jgi:hypothetical protein
MQRRALYMTTYVRFTFAGGINLPQLYFCAAFSVYTLKSRVPQKNTHNTLLHLQGNNADAIAPQYYVICTLPVVYLLQSPEPPASWSGVRQATQYAPICIQRSVFAKQVDITGSEDCLYLNVFTPRVRVLRTDAHHRDKIASTSMPLLWVYIQITRKRFL